MIFASILFFAFCVLCVRSVILMLAEPKPILNRLSDFFAAALFGLIAFVLSVFLRFRFERDLMHNLMIFAIVFLPVALALILRLRKPFKSRPVLFIFKAAFVLLLIGLAGLALMASGFLYLSEDKPFLKITMTGKEQLEDVEWKSPSGSLRKEKLKAYEVQLARPSGDPIASIYVYGDQVAVKAKVIRFRPILNVIGFHNLVQIEYLYNGYTTADRFNIYPHRAQEIRAAHAILKAWQDVFWGFWEKNFYGNERTWWIKSATLESQFFPLVDAHGKPFRGSYFLTITTGGLSAVPLP
jgi:hypothetical protein